MTLRQKARVRARPPKGRGAYRRTAREPEHEILRLSPAEFVKQLDPTAAMRRLGELCAGGRNPRASVRIARKDPDLDLIIDPRRKPSRARNPESLSKLGSFYRMLNTRSSADRQACSPLGLGTALGSARRTRKADRVESSALVLIDAVGWIREFDPMRGVGRVASIPGVPEFKLHAVSLRAAGFTTASPGARIRCEVVRLDSEFQVFRVLELGSIAAAGLNGANSGDCVTPSESWEPASIKWFNKLRAFGFLNRIRDNALIYFQLEVLRRSGITDVRPGQRLMVRSGLGVRGLTAAEVMLPPAEFPDWPHAPEPTSRSRTGLALTPPPDVRHGRRCATLITSSSREESED